jgi:hypothetical protein
VPQALGREGEERLRPRLRADARAATPGEAAEAALIRLLLAALLALLGTALAYLLLGVVLGVAGGWSRQTALDQAIGLGIHAAVVFVRGVLPAVLATATACWVWRRWRGAEPGGAALLALALLLATLVTGLLLTPEIAGWPRLQVKRAVDGVATVLLLAAASAAAERLARRLVRRPRSLPA